MNDAATGTAVTETHGSSASDPGVASLALVQHAHQYLVTDGYDNREGLSEILDRFADLFALHLRSRVPLNLHLSGTFIEAVAWHDPSFFGWVRALADDGLLELIGSGYSQSILTLFSFEHGERQLTEAMHLYRRHLGVHPEDVRGLWLPERVWDTAKIAPLVTSSSLPNGGYRFILLDDRLAYAIAGPAPNRAQFDASCPPSRNGNEPWWDAYPTDQLAHLEPFTIEGGDGLIGVPMSSDLRYAIPPRSEEQWHALHSVLDATARARGVATFGDDLERSAAVGPWDGGAPASQSLAPYAALLRLIAESPTVEPVLLSPWLHERPERSTRRVDTGTFFELAHLMGATEDYSGWWDAPAWEPYRRTLAAAERVLRSERPAYPSRLWELAWKQLMACSYETAWHSISSQGVPEPTPWARALGAHARSVHLLTAAARFEVVRPKRPRADLVDIDSDGRDEIVLTNEHLLVVITPRYGARVVALLAFRGMKGRMVVGNPADDWNWQEELNQHMEVPRNHPGAFADVGHENDEHRVDDIRVTDEFVEVRLVNEASASALDGTVKIYRLRRGASHLDVRYETFSALSRFAIDVALSPDYLMLLRKGRAALRGLDQGRTRGARTGRTLAWLRLPSAEPLIWGARARNECGHAVVLRTVAFGSRFRFELGVGTPPAGDENRELIDIRESRGIRDDRMVER